MSSPVNNATLDTLQALERAPSVLKVKEVFRRAAENCGFTSFLCSAPPRPEEKSADPILFDAWPREWRQRYGKRRYYLHDPMLAELYRTTEPFTWSAVMARATPSAGARAVMDDAATIGLREGFVVPIYGIGGQVHAVTMNGSAPQTDKQSLAELHLISIYAYARAKQLKGRPGVPPITLRWKERQVLQWAAAGKSDWEIGQILGISESAAHKHIENVKRRIGVNTRVQAIIEAIRQGQIHL